jgi:lipopolysaccharide biosynthesis glycosyltransferase
MDNVVYFTVDGAFLPMALATASALVEEQPRNFDVVIFLTGKQDSSLNVPAGVRVFVKQLDRMLPASIDVRPPWGAITYTRIFGPMALAGQYRRALYLDADTAVFRPVSALFALDMKGMPLAAVEGMMPETTSQLRYDFETYKAELGLDDGRIFNAGVMLIDIDAWSRIDHGQLLNHYATEVQPRLIQRVGTVLADQDYLNFVLHSKWLALSPRWNFQTHHLRLDLEDLLDPAIVHYVGPRRPWDNLLFPYGARHTRYYSDRLRRIGMERLSAVRTRSYYQRYLADQVRQLLHNKFNTVTKQQMFQEWHAMRTAMKEAIETRLRTGQYEDVRQGISAVEMSNDPLADATIEDFVYYRKRIRPQSSVNAGFLN